MSNFDMKIDSNKNELKSEISRVEGVLRTKIETVDSRVEDLDKRLDIVQRLTVIEARQRDFEKRLSQ